MKYLTNSLALRLCVWLFHGLLEYLIPMNKMKITTISTSPYRSYAFKSNLRIISRKSSYITLAKNRTKFRAGIFLTHIFVKVSLAFSSAKLCALCRISLWVIINAGFPTHSLPLFYCCTRHNTDIISTKKTHQRL